MDSTQALVFPQQKVAVLSAACSFKLLGYSSGGGRNICRTETPYRMHVVHVHAHVHVHMCMHMCMCMCMTCACACTEQVCLIVFSACYIRLFDIIREMKTKHHYIRGVNTVGITMIGPTGCLFCRVLSRQSGTV